MVVCFAVINSDETITLKTINDDKAEFFRKHILKMKTLSIAFCSPFLISNDFLPRNGKTQTNSFFGTTQIFVCLITKTFYIEKRQ